MIKRANKKTHQLLKKLIKNKIKWKLKTKIKATLNRNNQRKIIQKKQLNNSKIQKVKKIQKKY